MRIDDDVAVPARTVIIATGAAYRRLELDNLAQFEGAGVYYGATAIEAQVCRGSDVVVVGGGNSAGQAAVFLAQSARQVFMLVRGKGLAATMSRYLIRRIEDNPAITLLTETEIVALDGATELERVQWRHRPTRQVETRDLRHVFVMTGASPTTEWLQGCVAIDAARLHQDRPGPLARGPRHRRLAAVTAAAPARDQPPRGVRRRRRARRKHQAGGLGGR